jgi:flagellar biosynthesis protein FliR
MSIPLDNLFASWDVFLLVLVRISGMFMLSPVFGRRNIPNAYKTAFAFLVSLIAVQSVTLPDAVLYTSLMSFILMVGKELLIGLAMGFISYMVFSAIYVAGQLIDMRIGFGMVNVFDPISNVQVPITADFYVVLATLFIFITNSHHLIFLTITQSFQLLPLGETTFTVDLLGQTIRLFGVLFSIGFRIAAPVTVAILVTDMALGIISKSVPQMNVFMLGLPVKLLMGLVVMYLTLGAFRGIVSVLTEGMIREMNEFLRLAGGASP